MKIAVEGCAHGELEKIYSTIETLEKKHSIKIDLLICCGDFQSVRNKIDLNCLAAPSRFREMKSFHKFYSGQLKAPILTIFIGGNHEASNYLAELPYGGWVCPNIYYMGLANIIQIGGVRIGGLSGIYKPYNYQKGHYELFPYDNETLRSVYHVRNVEVFRLKQIKNQIDIFLSHDWPRGIEKYGSIKHLLKCKPFFRRDIESGKLGSEPAAELLHLLKPSYWFSAHLHLKFSAVVRHNDKLSNVTRFLALDKCLPRRDFLQIFDIPHDNDKSIQLEYDPEWLCILKMTDHLLSTSRERCIMPERFDFTSTSEEIEELIKEWNNEFSVPFNFSRTSHVYDPLNNEINESQQAQCNPQTTEFCEKFNVRDLQKILIDSLRFNEQLSCTQQCLNPDEICLSDDDDKENSGIDFNSQEILLNNDDKFIVENLTSVNEGRNTLVKKSIKRRNFAIYGPRKKLD